VSSATFVFRMAWREARAEGRRLALLAAAVATGVSALVAIDSFTANLQESVRHQAQALLGADLSFSSRKPFSPRTRALLDTLAAPPQGATASLTNFPGMAYVPRTAGTRLVQVSAVEGAYPFYGAIQTAPARAWAELQSGRHAVVDPVLLTALNARVGDTLALGEGRFEITGTLVNLAGDVGIRTALGPRVFVPATYLAETKLLRFGAQAQYEAYVKLPAGRSAQAIATRYRPILPSEQIRIHTVADDRQDLNDMLTRLARYLGLVALIALLLGGIGVGSAVVVFVRRKLDTIAVLRCLGASAGQVFLVYLVQAVALGLAGSVVGAALGVFAQQALPGLLRGLLPVDVRMALSWRAVALGVGMGAWVAVAFALLPLASIRLVSPLAALRRTYQPAPAPHDRWRDAAAIALAASVVALAALQVGSWRTGAIFSAAIGASLALLWLASWALVRGVRRWSRAAWPYVWRQGLANLYRPGNQTVAVVLAVGFGAFLLSTLFLVQHNLLRGLEVTGGTERPNLLLLDIQTDQVSQIERELRSRNLPFHPPVPIVPMRILSVKDRPVARLLADTSGAQRGERSNAWAFRREYRSTYRDSLVPSERVTAGRWWQPGASASARGGAAGVSDTTVPVSVENGLAKELGIGLGDAIVWDVQGRSIVSRVANLREVDWARFEPNFFVVFAPGALEQAPQMFVTLTRIDDPGARGRLQRALAERYANITTVDLSLVQQTLERLVERVTLAIRFMALFSLVTGALVLVGAIATSRLQRIREAVLLKALGATRRQLRRIALAEYLCLGLLSSGTAIVLASAAGWGLARYFFEGTFWLPLLELGGLAAAIVALTVAVGLWSSREVLKMTPLEALRAE
jgi:putative ABC transport system permease protein